LEGEVGRIAKPGGAQAKEVGAADGEQLRRLGGVNIPPVEGVDGLEDELAGQTFGGLLLFKERSNPGGGRMASPSVGLRYAPASYRAGHAGEKQSHFVPPDCLILFPPQQQFSTKP
jgi:hypothetical protein